MKFLLLAFALLFLKTSTATTYYFSSASGQDTYTPAQAQNKSTPWRTLAKLNAIFSTLTPGDSVLLKSGETFQGSIKVVSSGTSGKPIFIGSFGTGQKPVISGLNTITEWKGLGNGLYEKELIQAPNRSVNTVLLNNAVQPVGRFPKAGQKDLSYLYFNKHSISKTGVTIKSHTIVSDQIASIPNFAGGELVQRTMQWIIDRATITAQNSTSITSTPMVSPGHPTVTYEPIDGHGFFIQNHINTLKEIGDWCYNKSTKKFTMNFGAANPAAYLVEAGTVDTLMTIVDRNYITLSNLEFKGANEYAVYLSGTTFIKADNCNFYNSGIDAINVDRIYQINTNNTSVTNCHFNNNLNNAINAYESTYWTIANNTIENTGTIQGMGMSGDGQYIGVASVGANSLVEYNEIKNTGYSAIYYTGANTIIRFNHVHRFCLGKSDGGGIYTYGVTGQNRLVHRNIVHDGIGDRFGMGEYETPYSSQVHGIYNDSYSSGISITENTSFNNSHSGMWFGSNKDISAKGNTFYNNKTAQIKSVDNEELLSNITVDSNILFAKEKGSLVMSMNITNTSLGQLNSNNNYLCRPIWEPANVNAAQGYTQIPFSWDNYHDGGTIETNHTFYSVENWRQLCKLDRNSLKTPTAITSQDEIVFEYNATKQPKTVVLNGTYKDLKNNYYTSITLEPYTSIILLKTETLTKINQSIDFAPLAPKTYGAEAFIINAVASSGLPVSFSVVYGPAVINGNTLSLTGAGPVLIEATQAGNANFNAATAVRQSFNVSKVSQVINFPAITSKLFGTAPFAIVASASSGLPVSFRVVSGPATIAGNIVTLTGTGNITIEATQAGNNSFDAAVATSQSFNSMSTSPATLTPLTSCSATGNILREQWNNIGGTLVSDIPLKTVASSTSLLTKLETENTGSLMGARISGYICAPIDGNFTFYIAGDDGVELWLSTDDNPANKIKIAGFAGWTGYHEWNKYPTQKSTAIKLVAGKRYYIEVLHKNGSGGDNVSVKWDMPNGTTEAPIPGNRLSPFSPVVTTRLNQTISFNALPGKSFGDPAFTLSAIATSNLPVSFKVISGPATVTGNTITLTGAGTVTVEATQAGNTTYDAAVAVSQSFNVAKANQTISFASVTSKIFGTAPFSISASASSGLTVLFRIVSGPATLSGNIVTLTGTGLVTIEASQAGNGNFNKAAAVNQTFNVAKATTTQIINTCSATGNILREQWDNIFGTQVADIPQQKIPSSTSQLSMLETQNTGDWMAARIRGYICPPLDGNYTFYIAGDDGVELWLSTDDNPANKIKIAGYTGWTGYQEWNKYPGQKSTNQNLQAGKRYYIEVLHKNGAGGDHVSVKWDLPNATTEAPIPGKRLSPFVVTSAVKLSQSINFAALEPKTLGDAPITLTANATSGLPVNFSLTSGPATLAGNVLTITGTGIITIKASQPGNTSYNAAAEVINSFIVAAPISAPTCSATGSILREYWSNIFGTAVADITLQQTPTGTSQINKLETENTGDWMGARIRGYLCPPLTGNYTFSLSGDDGVELWLSTDDNPANKIKIAGYTGWTGFREFDKYPSQQSTPINLQSGKRYYIEVLHKNGSGGDHVSVKWELPNGVTEMPIPGSRLSPYTNTVTNKINQNINFPSLAAKNFGDPAFNLNATASSGLPVSFSIVSGPATINGNTVTLTGTGLVTVKASQAGNNYYFPATTVTNSFNVAAAIVTPTCSATGSILREQWTNIFGTQVSDIPLKQSPNGTGQITKLETENTGDWMGARIRGYICAPVAGNYTFYISGDDGVELWLSTDDNPANKIKIAGYTGWTGFHEWDKYPGQKSSVKKLEPGKRYYIEVLHKNGAGGDNVSVKWEMPNGVIEAPIPGTRLSPYVNTPTTVSFSSNNKELTVSPEENGAPQAQLSVYPNPIVNAAKIKVLPSESGEASISLIDLQGRIVRQIYKGHVDINETKIFQFNPSGLASGVYIVHFATKNKILTQKVTLVK